MTPGGSPPPLAPGPGWAAWAFVDDLEAPELEPADAHHLGRVLRVRPGQPVGVSDGGGRWRACAVTAVDGRGVHLEPVGPVAEEPAARPPVTVGFSLVKGDRPELVVQKLTELGVDRILPVAAHRSVVVWDPDRSVRRLARLRQVAREAAMQSRRTWLPELAETTTVAAAAATLGAAGGLCQQGGGERPSLRRPALLTGPEGGWDQEELATALPLVDLGPTTLRAETAAIAAGVLLCGLRSATVREDGSGSHPCELGPTA